ncbi:MAG: cation diffusion facilitator family transporter [Tepidimonas sp.]|uniref:cation diffusion facilitator family transporter n=1 Tax=Tepidimonas sp. TaxID=2002775 RepID=UPI00259EFB83|nr:cation diffusion facilitator family transporter [Tepidimonas sp.]MDM7457104.1 cation diffusion facilitator family transporter [Tepidimonas sp.]
MGSDHVHSHAPADFGRAFAIGIVLNLAFVGAEAYYGWKVDSLALLADAGHNLSDVAGLVLAWAGAMAGKLRANARHTYGWRKASILAAFVNAVLLLLAMGALGWEALQRLMFFEGTTGHEGATIMVVAGIGIVVNTATALLFARGRDTDLNIRGAFLHMAADALVSAGVVVAGALTLWLNWAWLDPLVSLLIAAIIVWGTWSLFRQSLHLLFDGVPEAIDGQAVHDYLARLTGVQSVRDLHIWGLDTQHSALTAHLVIPEWEHSDRFLHEAADALHDRFGITHCTIQITRQPTAMSCQGWAGQASPSPQSSGHAG